MKEIYMIKHVANVLAISMMLISPVSYAGKGSTGVLEENKAQIDAAVQNTQQALEKMNSDMVTVRTEEKDGGTIIYLVPKDQENLCLFNELYFDGACRDSAFFQTLMTQGKKSRAVGNINQLANDDTVVIEESESINRTDDAGYKLEKKLTYWTISKTKQAANDGSWPQKNGYKVLSKTESVWGYKPQKESDTKTVVTEYAVETVAGVTSNSAGVNRNGIVGKNVSIPSSYKWVVKAITVAEENLEPVTDGNGLIHTNKKTYTLDITKPVGKNVSSTKPVKEGYEVLEKYVTENAQKAVYNGKAENEQGNLVQIFAPVHFLKTIETRWVPKVAKANVGVSGDKYSKTTTTEKFKLYFARDIGLVEEYRNNPDLAELFKNADDSNAQDRRSNVSGYEVPGTVCTDVVCIDGECSAETIVGEINQPCGPISQMVDNKDMGEGINEEDAEASCLEMAMQLGMATNAEGGTAWTVGNILTGGALDGAYEMYKYFSSNPRAEEQARIEVRPERVAVRTEAAVRVDAKDGQGNVVQFTIQATFTGGSSGGAVIGGQVAGDVVASSNGELTVVSGGSSSYINAYGEEFEQARVTYNLLPSSASSPAEVNSFLPEGYNYIPGTWNDAGYTTFVTDINNEFSDSGKTQTRKDGYRNSETGHLQSSPDSANTGGGNKPGGAKFSGDEGLAKAYSDQCRSNGEDSDIGFVTTGGNIAPAQNTTQELH
ncbi:hypothetical protein K1X76_06190 [bacterium]|nr:hypothetical protein [bacterium]